MGYEVYSSASFTIPGTIDGRARLRRVAAAVPEIPEICLDIDAAKGDRFVVGTALMAALGVDDGSCYDDEAYTNADETAIALCPAGEGRINGIDELLAVFATEGLDGEVSCEGEDGERWRWRVADSRVHRDNGTTIYDTDSVWIVQMQSVDEGHVDHIAVVYDQRESTAILAGWAREEASKLAADGAIAADTLDPDACDEDVLERWADIGGVKWDVYQRPLTGVF